MGKSIFEFADKFGYDSPLQENWAEVAFENTQNVLKITRIEGPFKENGQIAKFVNRFEKYYYLISTNTQISNENIYQINWAVSYDDKIETFNLFSGGKIEKNKVKVSINISEGIDKYKIYAYTGNRITNNIFIEALYKKTVVFFIGGAGDKREYLGNMPTNIVRRNVEIPFSTLAPKKDYTSVYLGYYEVYGDDRIKLNVLSKIKNKEGTEIYIVGHSLGGWNGAHLYTKLQSKGYNVKVLITLDPVGKGLLVNLFSDIYDNAPNPNGSFWFNTYTDPITYALDDLIADLGVQWVPDGNQPLVNIINPYHHGEAGSMFKQIVYMKSSMSDMLLVHINKYLQEQ